MLGVGPGCCCGLTVGCCPASKVGNALTFSYTAPLFGPPTLQFTVTLTYNSSTKKWHWHQGDGENVTVGTNTSTDIYFGSDPFVVGGTGGPCATLRFFMVGAVLTFLGPVAPFRVDCSADGFTAHYIFNAGSGAFWTVSFP